MARQPHKNDRPSDKGQSVRTARNKDNAAKRRAKKALRRKAWNQEKELRRIQELPAKLATKRAARAASLAAKQAKVEHKPKPLTLESVIPDETLNRLPNPEAYR